MQEYIVGYDNKWWHFFVNPMQGLCYRKKETLRFGNFEILLKNVENDFCVLSLGKYIHIVCQDKEGSMIYLVYNGTTWEKTILLESKDGKSYPKHFKLVPIGAYLNLFYIIEYKERSMLVHQILDGTDKSPLVLDYISMNPIPFFVCQHVSTDLTVCYQNAQGTWGYRIFKWSKKDYLGFVSLQPSSEVSVGFVETDRNDVCHVAAIANLDGIKNIVYYRKNPSGDYIDPITVYLDCQDNASPILCRFDDKLFMLWIEFGCVMSAYSENNGLKWSKPIKYVKHTSIKTVLYHLCIHSKYQYDYGYSSDSSIQLYVANELLSRPPVEQPAPNYQSRGQEAIEFSKQTDFIAPPKEEHYVTKQELIGEITEVKQLLSNQNDIILELLRRQNQLEDDLVMLAKMEKEALNVQKEAEPIPEIIEEIKQEKITDKAKGSTQADQEMCSDTKK